MSVELNPGIAALDPESLCYSLYTQLYAQFFNAQDRKDEQHPYGIEEGDDTSLRLRNTAYGFAYAIAGSVEGNGTGGGTGGILLDYLKKSGGEMSGPLAADYGFGAGIANRRVVETYREPVTDAQGQIADYNYELHVAGDLRVKGNHLYFGGQQFITYIGNLGTMFIRYPKMDFAQSKIRTRGDLLFGENRTTGIYISSAVMEIAGHGVYHAGNANQGSIDWRMRDAVIEGALHVGGSTEFSSVLTALNGVSLGLGDTAMISLSEESIDARAHLSFAAGYGIRINDSLVLARLNEKDIGLSGAGGDLLLGGSETSRIKLLSGVWDADGDYALLSPHGAAYFPDSLTVRHNYGDELLSTYRVNKEDEGVVIHKRLRWGTSAGPYLWSFQTGIAYNSFVEHISPDDGRIDTLSYNATVRFGDSTSHLRPADRISDSLVIDTDADFIRFDKPIEAKKHIGIDNSLTRLTDGSLFFSEDKYLLCTANGIKYFGNSYFLDDVSSEFFSSGFAGSGWAILHNRTTGNRSATFDELTVRKKMRIYELEVQKSSAANGSLWISDSCSGDTVELIQ